MPGFWKTLKKSLADSYDYLGLVLSASFVWFGVALGGLAVIVKVGRSESALFSAIAVCAFYVVVLSPATAGVYTLATKIVTRDDPSLLELIRGARERLVSSWALGLTQMLITLLVAANVAFYLTREGIPLKAVGVLFSYVMIAWLLSAVYHFPVLVEQDPGVLRVLKRSFLLMADNPAFTAGVFFVIILLTSLCLVTLLGLPLLYLGVMSVICTRALRALFVKYEILPPELEFVSGEEATGKRSPAERD